MRAYYTTADCQRLQDVIRVHAAPSTPAPGLRRSRAWLQPCSFPHRPPQFVSPTRRDSNPLGKAGAMPYFPPTTINRVSPDAAIPTGATCVPAYPGGVVRVWRVLYWSSRSGPESSGGRSARFAARF